MDRRRGVLVTRLFGLILPLILVGAIYLGPDPQTGCGFASSQVAGCVSGTIHGGGVDLSGNKSTGGSSGTGSGSHSGGSTKKPATPDCQLVPEACQTFGVIPPPVVSHPGVTLNDLKSFTPKPGTDHMQPNGWMIVGLSTNFYSVVGVEVQNGQLLGAPASVRFTPISWHWSYGDGASATKNTPGRTWAKQGISEFDPTPTSHVYAREGTYFIDLSIGPGC